MCVVCERFEERVASGSVADPYGAVAQLVERHAGSVDVARSTRVSSTQCTFADTLRGVGACLCGLIAAEGSFLAKRQGSYASGDDRYAFRLEMTLADRDLQLLHALKEYLGGGSISPIAERNPAWQRASRYSILASRKTRDRIFRLVDAFMPDCAKRDQFERWRTALLAQESAHPPRDGRGICKEPDCDDFVRGRGVCRRHYYRLTGY